MVKANVDLILDYLRIKKSASIPEIARATKIPAEAVQKSVEYLEEDGVLKIDYKLTTPYVYLIEKKETTQQKVEAPTVKQTPLPSMQIQSIPTITLSEPREKPKQEEQPKEGIELNINLNVGHETNSFENQQSIPIASIQPSANIQTISQPEAQNILSNNQIIQPVDKNLFSENDAVKEIKNVPNFETEIIDKNPLEERPNFDLNPPMPETISTISKDNLTNIKEKPFIKPALSYTSEFSDTQIDIPEYIESDAQKIDFLIEYGLKKIENYDYKDLNALYRRIYNLFKDSVELSPNERFLIGEKINDLFQRIKRIYLIEEVV